MMRIERFVSLNSSQICLAFTSMYDLWLDYVNRLKRQSQQQQQQCEKSYTWEYELTLYLSAWLSTLTHPRTQFYWTFIYYWSNPTQILYNWNHRQFNLLWMLAKKGREWTRRSTSVFIDWKPKNFIYPFIQVIITRKYAASYAQLV